MSGLQVLHGSELNKAMPATDCAKSSQRVWQDVFSDESGQATVETLLLLGAVILPLAVGAYFWVDFTRHLFSRNAKYLALPFP